MRRHIAALGGIALALSPAPALAETVGGSVTSFGIGDWFGLVLRLGLVIGVIWAAVYAMRWYTRRMGGERSGTARTLDIVETRSLGPNRALHLVRIGGRAVLIGVTPERINALMEVDDPKVLEAIEAPSEGTPRSVPAFATLLAGLGAGGHTTNSAQDASSSRGASDLPRAAAGDGLRRMTAMAARLRPRRAFLDRLLALVGFTPVESLPQLVERMRAERLATTTMPARSAFAAPSMRPMNMPAPAAGSTVGTSAPGAVPARPVIAPSATQALRALSGYRAAQESSEAAPASPDRDERIAEAQRAIAAARQKVG